MVLGDIEFQPIGIQLDCEAFDTFFYFNHVMPCCGTTFVIPAAWFDDYLEEEQPPELIAGSEECEGRCLDRDDCEECRQHCRNAPYRRLLKKLVAAYPRPTTADATAD